MNGTLELTAKDKELIIRELVPEFDPVTLELQKYASETGLEPPVQKTLADAFRPVFLKAHEAIAAAAGVAESVKDATCVREIKKSRECRLAIRAVRIEGEKIHKSQKESAIRFGRAVDGFKNILLAELGPVEEALDAAEKTAERAEAARLAALKARREAELLPLLDGSPIMADLSALSETAWTRLLADHQLLRQAKLDAAAKAEAKEAADRAERERIAAENARLKAEAEAAAKLLEEERKQREKERIEAEREHVRVAQVEREKAEVEKRAIEEKARKEREDAKAERDRILAMADAQERKAKVERDALQAKATAVLKEHAAQVSAVAADQARLRAELQARVDAEVQAKREEEARLKTERKAAEAAAKRAAAAPDKSKLEAYIRAIMDIPVPTLTTDIYADTLESAQEGFIAQIRKVITAISTPTDDAKLL